MGAVDALGVGEGELGGGTVLGFDRTRTFDYKVNQPRHLRIVTPWGYPDAMRWPWAKRVEQPTGLISVADPALAALFTPGGVVDLAGVVVGETSSLGLSAFYRALALISGTLASLPLKSLRDKGNGQSEPVGSVFDDPDGPDGQTVFEWKESLFLHLLLHGKAGALKVRTEAGSLVRLPLVHPLCFQVCQPTLDEYATGQLPAGGVWFDVSLNDGTQVRLDADSFWYVPGPSLGGQVGISLLTYARQSLATSIAADKAAAQTFANGALISGLATPADDLDIADDIPQLRRELNRNVLGHENAGTIALVNRRLTFTPWTMTAEQAQFLQSRQFQIEEIARWTGVPPHLLMQTDKQTSWGTGVDEQNRGLSKFVLGHWAQRVEQRGSRLLAQPRRVEFDFAGLERPNYAVESQIDLAEVNAGVMTPDEYRAKRGRPPLPKPDPAPAPDPNGGGNDPAAQ
jgi:HK97 family phage portal protein